MVFVSSSGTIVVSPVHGNTALRIDKPDILSHTSIPSLTAHTSIATQIIPLLIVSPCIGAIGPGILLENCSITGVPQMNSSACFGSIV